MFLEGWRSNMRTCEPVQIYRQQSDDFSSSQTSGSEWHWTKDWKIWRPPVGTHCETIFHHNCSWRQPAERFQSHNSKHWFFYFFSPSLILVAVGLCVLAADLRANMCNSQRIKAGGFREIASEDDEEEEERSKWKEETGHSRQDENLFDWRAAVKNLVKQQLQRVWGVCSRLS